MAAMAEAAAAAAPRAPRLIPAALVPIVLVMYAMMSYRTKCGEARRSCTVVEAVGKARRRALQIALGACRPKIVRHLALGARLRGRSHL